VSNRGDDVFFQFDAHRVVVERGKNIDDAAAHTEVARLFGLRDALIAHRSEGLDDRVKIDAFGERETNNRVLEDPAGQRPHHQGLGRSDDDRRGGAKHREERSKLSCLGVGWRREMGEWTDFPRGQEMHSGTGGIAGGGLIEKEREFTGQSLGLARERGDRNDWAIEIEHRLA
jgi:hypothetical protein